MRVKNQLIVPRVNISVGDLAVRVAGASLWNNMHKDMKQYRLKKCLKGKLTKYYIAKYHTWCIDWCLFLSVFNTYLSLLERNIALFHSELCWHFLYLPGYHLNFYLVVSKMSLVPPDKHQQIILYVLYSWGMLYVYMLEEKITTTTTTCKIQCPCNHCLYILSFVLCVF